MVKRNVCVITGSRAEYGLLRWVIEGIRQAPELHLQLVATGMHLSPEFGLTYRDIEADGFKIDRRVEMLLSSDTSSGIAKSIGLGLIGFGGVLEELNPDLMLVLGDRFEVFAAVTAALVAGIPVAHLHGGESTEGAIDEAIRHSITKMSHLHFVATDEYRRRVIQLGEDPSRVFEVGGLGIDSIRKLTLLSRPELERELGMSLRRRNLLVTFHPATLEGSPALVQLEELLAALESLEDTGLIFTMPNADSGGRAICARINDFVSKHDHAVVFTSMGQLKYLSCVSCVDGVVGNSSSGLIEVPSFKKGTVNIGERQTGRVRAASVIDCAPRASDIKSALDRLFSSPFQASLEQVRNPYGSGGASDRIVSILCEYPLNGIVKKRFFDLELPEDRSLLD